MGTYSADSNNGCTKLLKWSFCEYYLIIQGLIISSSKTSLITYYSSKIYSEMLICKLGEDLRNYKLSVS